MIELAYQISGEPKRFRSEQSSILIGRQTNSGTPVDLDLPDPTVSREHARVSAAGASYGVMALQGGASTTLNGRELMRGEHCSLAPGDELNFGAVGVRVQAIGMSRVGAAASAPGNRYDALVEIMETVTAAVQQATELWQRVVELAVTHVPTAEGASLISYAASESLCLAHTQHVPKVSRIILDKARESRHAFLWPDDVQPEPSPSQRKHGIRCALCAPLLVKGEVAGVLFAANHSDGSARFTEDDRRWLALLAQAAAAALALQRGQAEVQSLTRLKTGLLAHFSPLLRQRLLEQASAKNFRPGGERLVGAAVLQADLRGFTKLAAQLDPGEVIEMLNSVFAETNEAVFKHDGIIDKFIGDAVLVVFETPTPHGPPGLRAVRAALAMQRAVLRINRKRASRTQEELALGIGIHTGDLVQGFVGTSEKHEYTVIGDTVNQACRCCEAAGRNEIFISVETWRPLYQDLVAEKCDRKNKDGPRSGYRVTGLTTREVMSKEGAAT
jgi:adenylate cyclase